MYSEGSSSRSGLMPSPANVPSRAPVKMQAGELIAWTPLRMALALGGWVMQESQLPAQMPAPLAVTPKRRA